MRYSLVFSEQSQKVLKKWKKSNPSVFKKASEILNDIAEHPREGRGHPEALIGGSGIIWSRRITAHDRVIYEIHDEIITVDILTVEGHYNDK